MKELLVGLPDAPDVRTGEAIPGNRAVTLDPVWPWSHLWSFLAAGGPRAGSAALVLAALALLLPFLLPWRPARPLARAARLGLLLLPLAALLVLLRASGPALAALAGR